MDLNQYKNLVKSQATEIEYNGEKHYCRLPSGLDLEFIELMQNKDIKQAEKMAKCLASIICDADGMPIFNREIDEHLIIIKSLPADLQVKMINLLESKLFPKKK